MKAFKRISPFILLSLLGAAGVTSAQEATPFSSVASEKETSFLGATYYVGGFLGSLNIKTDVKRETDKKGSLLGVEVGGRWNFSDAFASAALGYLTASTKGSSSMTNGDETASLMTPYVDVNAGYKLIPLVSAAVGLQVWVKEGADFAPEDKAKGNKLFYYLDVGIHPAMTPPLSFNMRYTADLNIEDRNAAAVTLGMQYPLPL